MANYSAWQYDEMQQIGKDYGNVAEVEAYDLRHNQLRNIQKESQFILDRLAVRKEQVILDFGAGTGTFAIKAAKRCSKVYAVDVSRVMLDYAERRPIPTGATISYLVMEAF